jgi:hypothetical protein
MPVVAASTAAASPRRTPQAAALLLQIIRPLARVRYTEQRGHENQGRTGSKYKPADDGAASGALRKREVQETGGMGLRGCRHPSIALKPYRRHTYI